jgi:hypothetical protein
MSAVDVPAPSACECSDRGAEQSADHGHHDTRSPVVPSGRKHADRHTMQEEGPSHTVRTGRRSDDLTRSLPTTCGKVLRQGAYGIALLAPPIAVEP